MSATASPASPVLRGIWLIFARAAWVAVAFVSLGSFVISVPARYSQLANPTAGVRAALAEMGLSASGYALYNVVRETMQPAHTSLWLRSPTEAGRVEEPSG